MKNDIIQKSLGKLLDKSTLKNGRLATLGMLDYYHEAYRIIAIKNCASKIDSQQINVSITLLKRVRNFIATSSCTSIHRIPRQGIDLCKELDVILAQLR